MTKVRMFRSGSSIRGFSIKGHAGSAAGSEYDMVCAAISGIAYTALAALESLCNIRTYKESDGEMNMMLPSVLEKDCSYKASIILETMEIGLKQIEHQYPQYIQTVCKEVPS